MPVLPTGASSIDVFCPVDPSQLVWLVKEMVG
jgi:hypothetical protein